MSSPNLAKKEVEVFASLLDKFGPFNEALTRSYVSMVLCGLTYLHDERNILHRDIKVGLLSQMSRKTNLSL